MDNQLTLWDVAFLPSLLLIRGVTPDRIVVVRISTEIVLSYIFVLVFVGFLFRPDLAIFSRPCLVHLALVVFPISFTVTLVSSRKTNRRKKLSPTPDRKRWTEIISPGSR